MSVKCGRGHNHENISEVRACYQVTTEDTKATDKQVRFLDRLMSRANAFLASGEHIDQLPKRTASLLIDGMLDHLNKGKPVPAGVLRHVTDTLPAAPDKQLLPDVPAGHYAVPSLTGNNDLDFFRVDRPNEGRWAGRTFVKRVIGGRPSSPVRWTAAMHALEAIMSEGIEKAGARYGVELGQCRICNRHLTDELSRSLGIGPDCRSRH